MARLTWGNPGERHYETGVDRGVLYVGNDSVAWPGLISVNETPSGGQPRPYYLDGLKYLNLASAEEFEATINAFAAPKEFAPCDGTMAVQNGLFATQQPRKAFNLSYRTLIGNDTEGKGYGYKIHLVYNALAGPSERNNATMGQDVEPNTYTWAITTLPPSLTGMKPTAHFVIDSRFTPKGLLAHIEDILYGTAEAVARIPLVSELISLFQSQGPELRRNFALDPRITVTTNWTGLDVNRGITAPAYGPNVAAVENDIWTVSFDVLAEGVETTLQVAARPTSGAAFGAIAYSPTEYVVSPGQTVRVSDSTQIPAGADGFRPYVSSTVVDGTVKISNVLIEKTSVVRPYFDGDTFDENSNFYSWVGPPNASESIVNSWN